MNRAWAAVATRVVRVVVVGLLAVTVLASAAWVLWLAWLSAWTGVDAPGPASTAELMTLVAASFAIAIAAWLLLGAVLEVLSHLPGRMGATAGRWADRLTPALARRVAAFLLGVGVGVAGGPSQAVGSSRELGASGDLGSSMSASTAPSPGFHPAARRGAQPVPSAGFEPSVPPADRSAPAPGFEPTAPHGSRSGVARSAFPAAVTGATPAPTTPRTPGFTPSAPRVRKQADPTLLGARASGTDRPGANRPDADEVVVRRGDTLWSIAAAHLGADAEDAEVARAWPRWFEANRDVIGDDPDRILPGQVLRVPDPSASAAR
ncbi:LysM peptidoglycan-binding domain-containing protein [Rothia sp. ARF10]|nr:LysM peptidoglycan-binding domain-containing protein [Rothia sp. ARF10]